MGIFTRANRGWSTDPAELAAWRGRAAAITDAAEMPADVVFEALKTEPELPDDSPLYEQLDWPVIVMMPLGLQTIYREFYASDGDEGQANHFGARLGRPVLLRQGAQDRGGKSAWVTWVGAITEPFSLVASKGKLVVEGPLPEGVGTVLSGLGPAPEVWKDVHVVGGSDGIVAKRPFKMMSTRPWIYDLWLVERLADAAGTGTLSYPDPHQFVVPYGLDHPRHW